MVLIPDPKRNRTVATLKQSYRVIATNLTPLIEAELNKSKIDLEDYL